MSSLETAIDLLRKANASLDRLSVKDFPELKEIGLPPGAKAARLAEVMEACMHLHAGVNPDSDLQNNIDKRGKLKDSSWRSAHFWINNPAKFVHELKSFSYEIAEGKVPKYNVEKAKKILMNDEGPESANVGDSGAAHVTVKDEFRPHVLLRKNRLAGAVCGWMVNIIMYYDMLEQVRLEQLPKEEKEESPAAVNANKANEVTEKPTADGITEASDTANEP